MEKLNYKKLVIGSGGAKGYIMLGALHYAQELGLIDSVKEYWGVSVGSLIATFLIIGLKPIDIFFVLFQNGLITAECITLESLSTGLGFYPIETFGNKIRELVFKHYKKPAPTFLELYKQTGKSLNIIGTNLNTMSSEIFNYKKTPNMSIIDALEISCDIPYIFTKKVYDGVDYMDGGFVNEFPIDEADKDNSDNSKILGVWVKSCRGSSGNNYIDNIFKPIIASLTELQRLRMKNLSKNCDCIIIESTVSGFTDFNPDKKVKLDMFSTGYKKSLDFFTDLFMDGWDFDLKI